MNKNRIFDTLKMIFISMDNVDDSNLDVNDQITQINNNNLIGISEKEKRELQQSLIETEKIVNKYERPTINDKSFVEIVKVDSVKTNEEIAEKLKTENSREEK